MAHSYNKYSYFVFLFLTKLIKNLTGFFIPIFSKKLTIIDLSLASVIFRFITAYSNAK